MKKSIKIILVFVLAMILICTMLVVVACKDETKDPNKKDDPPIYVEYEITVQRSSGHPFPNATVLLYPENDPYPRPYFGTTDSNGVAVITALKADYTVKFTGITEGYKGDDNYKLLANEKNKVFKLDAEVISTPATKDTYYDLGSVMHNFSFTDIYGDKYSLKGLMNQYKAVLLNFWYVDCTWCNYEFPDMISSYDKYGQDIAVVAFNISLEEAKEQNRHRIYSYVESLGMPFIVADANESITGSLFNAFGFAGAPSTVVIDEQGVVCVKVEGALEGYYFDEFFQRYSAEPYEPYIYFPTTEKELPNVAAPSVEDVANAINADGMNATYVFIDDEYNWPWVIDGDAITTSNSEKHDSYSMINAVITATTSQCITFDYKLLSETNRDLFYVIVDGVVIHTYSGDISDWTTCYAYVPKEDGTHVISLAYVKDETKGPSNDYVSIKNMRYVAVEDIKEATEITYTAASGTIIDEIMYSNYITPVYNAEDGYYHVNSEDGPLLLADILNETNWANNSAWDFVGSSGLSYDLDGDGIEEDYLDNFTGIAQVANSSERYGLVAVTEDIATLLKILTNQYGNGHENEWLELCSYIEVYGADSKVGDPGIGLAPYNSYEAFESHDSNEVLNHVEKTRLIMPRGIYYRFIPSETAIYRVNSVGNNGTICWLYDANGRYITENSGAANDSNDENFVITRVFEEGVAYYIAVDFQFVEDLGEFDFVINKLATSGNVWVNASSGQYHTIVDADGNLIDLVLGGAVNYALGEDGVYHVKNNDGTLGSKLYINLADTTNLFPDIAVKDMIDMTCYYCKCCGYKYAGSVSYFESQLNPVCVLCNNVGNFEKRGMFELPTPLRDADGKIMVVAYQYEDGNVVYQPLYELNTREVKDYTDPQTYFNDLATYGIKFTDYTDAINEYVRLSEIEGNYPNEPEVGSSESHIGFYEATAELVDILNKFIVFGDYGITVSHENVWLMMSCYYKHLG